MRKLLFITLLFSSTLLHSNSLQEQIIGSWMYETNGAVYGCEFYDDGFCRFFNPIGEFYYWWRISDEGLLTINEIAYRFTIIDRSMLLVPLEYYENYYSIVMEKIE